MSACGTKQTSQRRRPMSVVEGNSGKHLLVASFSQFDPSRTSASISCCSSEIGCSPYQRAAGVVPVENDPDKMYKGKKAKLAEDFTRDRLRFIQYVDDGVNTDSESRPVIYCAWICAPLTTLPQRAASPSQ
jgi:hypothetical protein